MGIVSALVFLPFVAALIIMLVPKPMSHAIKWIALAGTTLHLVLTAYTIWLSFTAVVVSPADPTFTTLSLTENFPWFPSLGINYHIGVDGISLSMLALK